MKRARLLVPLLGALLFALVWGSGGGPSSAATSASGRVKPLPVRETCLRRAERRRALRFRAADGTRLLGIPFGRGPAGVVLAHGFRGDLCSWLAYARALSARGYRVLAFDARGHGSSASRGGMARWRVDLDAAAAVRELRRRGASSVVLVGSSMGATAVLVAAADVTPAVSGVISLSSPRQFSVVDAEGSVRRLQAPVLFAAAEFDDPFADDARALYQVAGAAEKRLLILSGSGDHGTRMLRTPEVQAAVDDFVAAHSAR